MILSVILIFLVVICLIFVLLTYKDSLKESDQESEITLQENQNLVDTLGISFVTNSEKQSCVLTRTSLSLQGVNGLQNTRQMLSLRVGQLTAVIPIRNNWDVLSRKSSNVPLLRMLRLTLLALIVCRKSIDVVNFDQAPYLVSYRLSALSSVIMKKYRNYSIQDLFIELSTEKMEAFYKCFGQRIFVIDYTREFTDLVEYLLMSFVDYMNIVQTSSVSPSMSSFGTVKS